LKNHFPKQITSTAFQAIVDHLPKTFCDLRGLLSDAVTRSRDQFYIVTEHLFEPPGIHAVRDLRLSQEQYEKFKAFCNLIYNLKSKGQDQVDIYKYVSKLREPSFRSDYEKEFTLSTLPSRSTLNRILDKVKQNSDYPKLKYRLVNNISIEEAVSFRK
jgi:hypothetical protein